MVVVVLCVVCVGAEEPAVEEGQAALAQGAQAHAVQGVQGPGPERRGLLQEGKNYRYASAPIHRTLRNC
jgi:hypothetical protein